MTPLLVKILTIIYKRFKTSPYLRALYYAAANTHYFDQLQVQEGMLADKVRVDTYYKAITKYVKEGDVVIDLGTGTGILSFFAASKKPRKVYAIEHGSIIQFAQLAANYNGITNIEFVKVHCKSFSVKEKVDVILQEQIGSFLFEEHMVENVVDLRDRALKVGGKILPSKFELFIEPVKLVDHKHIPFIWEQKIQNVSFACLKDLKPQAGSPYNYLFIPRDSVDYFLCEPERVLFFDLETIRIEDIPKHIQYVRTVKRDGRLDGFCLYFNVIFDEGISFTTSPFAPTTYWGHVLLRAESKRYRKGDPVHFDMVMPSLADNNAYTWSYA